VSVKALAGRSARARSGRFLVEGPQGVREAVRWAPDLVRDVYADEAAAVRHAQILSDALTAHLHVHTASQEVLDAMSSDAQGIMAVLDVTSPSFADVLASGPRLVAVLAHVRDPGNAGTVIRAADAAGAGAVVLTAESVDVHNPKVVRSTAGSLFHVPVCTGLSLADAVAELRSVGLAILAADGAGDFDLDDLLDVAGASSEARVPGVPDLSRPTAWVFGNEAWGLPEEDRALADAVVRVPIRGRAESLNLATAATVCLYASSRAHR
jgi:TrmH family RNA methyltransferase